MEPASARGYWPNLCEPSQWEGGTGSTISAPSRSPNARCRNKFAKFAFSIVSPDGCSSSPAGGGRWRQPEW